MASSLILPKGKVINTSCFSLEDSAFDQVNYRSGGAPANGTLSVDTPNGVLAGSCAACEGSADWTAGPGLYDSNSILGLFSDNSEGNAFENSPAAASGVVAIYMCGGLFDLFVFETNSAKSPYASILSSYTWGMPLYASKFGLLTCETPAFVSTSSPVEGVANVVAYLTGVPTAAALKMGIKLSC